MAIARDPRSDAAAVIPRRLFHQNLSLWRNRRVRRILALMGHELRLGRPGPEDAALVWGASPTAWRGEAMAARQQVPLVRLEDAFLRSVQPGRLGDAPLGLLIDAEGLHFDASRPSRLERILASDPLDNSHLLARAHLGIARIRALELSKYNIHQIELAPPAPGYVLVVDQTRNDASVRASLAPGQSADAAFDAMLDLARARQPQARILIKAHPETTRGLRPGHFNARHLDARTEMIDAPLSPWPLLEGAIEVHVLSSQLGFEAILAGHRPVVHGQPFYAGWGLSEDLTPPPRRARKLTRAQLFTGAMLLAPTWYDPCRDRLCSFEAALDQLEAETRAYREDRAGHVACGMRLWKRPHLQRFFGRPHALRFDDQPERAARQAHGRGKDLLIWASRMPEHDFAPEGLRVLRLEDGFLRSRGLGAELVAPMSLICDPDGVYHDPSRPSVIERALLAPLPPGGRERAENLLERLRETRLTKYNLSGQPLPDLRAEARGREIVLVPGQVEDDASVLKGGGEVKTNLALLAAARAAHPEAFVIWKPHPDVEAGLRPGLVTRDAALQLADLVLERAEMGLLLDHVDRVFTITSLTGFEALAARHSRHHAGCALLCRLGADP